MTRAVALLLVGCGSASLGTGRLTASAPQCEPSDRAIQGALGDVGSSNGPMCEAVDDADAGCDVLWGTSTGCPAWEEVYPSTALYPEAFWCDRADGAQWKGVIFTTPSTDTPMPATSLYYDEQDDPVVLVHHAPRTDVCCADTPVGRVVWGATAGADICVASGIYPR